MKSLVISGLIGAAMGAAVLRPGVMADVAAYPGAVLDLYARAFPGDPVKREALDLCFRQNHGFNRLAAAERTACYEQFVPTQHAEYQSRGAQGVATHAANFVDLWQAAGRGHQPQDDVRARQQAAQVARPVTARVTP